MFTQQKPGLRRTVWSCLCDAVMKPPKAWKIGYSHQKDINGDGYPVCSGQATAYSMAMPPVLWHKAVGDT